MGPIFLSPYLTIIYIYLTIFNFMRCIQPKLAIFYLVWSYIPHQQYSTFILFKHGKLEHSGYLGYSRTWTGR